MDVGDAEREVEIRKRHCTVITAVLLFPCKAIIHKTCFECKEANYTFHVKYLIQVKFSQSNKIKRVEN